ncbi:MULTISPECIES: MFS transporter [Herbaspirillum]|uniref:MFS transporter n=1 Tax=Herbaspirillum huttiense subsp. lycopersici TaxID=3074428 RepID=A0ABU2ELT6_9BURK|nr:MULTISPECIES: MFS transporter [Herbaspirillum]MBP1317376.1 MFS family permease [Herbaspirillum sp. 1130]MDR6741396.1 MFS family permease [Herbaspirillum sp. 1173]MDR9849105.1 MFS transporter [Herbaspirillum huttiense SE1]
MTVPTATSARAGLLLLCAGRMLQASAATLWAGSMVRMMAEWNLSAAQAGAVQSAWTLGYMVSLCGTGFIADRVGPRRVVLASAVLTAAAMLVFAWFSNGPALTALLYGLVGLCAGGSYSPALQLVAGNAQPHIRGRSMGMFIGAASLGYGLSLLLVALLASRWSWPETSALVAGLVTLGALLTMVALTRLKPDAVAPAQREHALRTTLRETLHDKPALFSSAAYAAHCWELMALWAWLPAYLAFVVGHAGLNPEHGLFIAALSHVVSVAGSLLGGSASDRYGRVRVMMLATCASLCCSFLFGWMASAPVWMLLVFAALYNLLAIADSSVYSTALCDVVPASRLGTAFAVRSLMGFGAGAISPWLFGMVLDWGQRTFALPASGWTLAWTLVGVGALAGPWSIRRFHQLSGKAVPGR